MANRTYRDPEDNITFNILNRHAVERLKRDGVIELPPKKVSIPKDELWNQKQMTSKILQGIQNGDSVRDISKSMESVVGNNKNSAIRNTRTMITSAQNHGRLDSYKELSAKGVVMKKEWEATPDDRTRPSHVDLDGEEQDIDKPFSNGCQFPGDGRGPAEEVWMCRCAMGSHIIGFRRKDGSISYVKGDRGSTLHDEQMSAERARRMKSKSKATSKTTDLEKGAPIIGGSYKATPEMEILAIEIAKRMQNEFPELLSEQFEIKFDKYMGNVAGCGFKDYIELNGAYFKREIKEEREYLEGMVAHELTHTMQSRLNAIMGIKGEKNRDKNIERIWNNAVAKYISDNPDKTVGQINKIIANSYGGGGHSKIGSRADEKMAVAVESIYAGGTGVVPSIGRYVIEELKLEILKLNRVYRKK